MIAPNYGNTGINPHQPGPLAPTSERDLILSLTGPPTPNPLTTPAILQPRAFVQSWLAKEPICPTLTPPRLTGNEPWMPQPRLLGPVTQLGLDQMDERRKAEFNQIAAAQKQTRSGRTFDAQQVVTNLHQATAGTLFDDHKMVRQSYFDLTPEQLKAVELVYRERYPAGDEREVLGVMPEVDRNAILKLRQGKRGEALTDLLLDSTLINKSGDKTKEVLDYIDPKSELKGVRDRFAGDSKRNPNRVPLDQAAKELMWDQEDKRVVSAKAQGDSWKQAVGEMRQALTQNKTDEAIDRLRALPTNLRPEFEKKFNAEVEAAKSTQLFNGQPLRDWVQADAGLNPLKGLEARAVLDNNLPKADALRIVSGDYGEKKEYLWRALGGDLKGPARDEHLKKVEAEFDQLAKKKGSLKEYLSSKLDPITKDQALTLLSRQDVPDGKRLAYDLVGWSKDGYDAARLIDELGPEKARAAFSKELPKGVKLSLDQVVQNSLGGRERFAAQQALKGKPVEVADKLARAQERVDFEHTGIALFSDAGKNLDDKMSQLKGYSKAYQEAVKKGDSKSAEAARREVDRAYDSVIGDAEVHRLEEKGTGEYSALAIQMAAAVATAIPTGGTSLELAVTGGVLSTVVNVAAQGEGYDHHKLVGDLAVNTVKSIPIASGESKVAGALAGNLVKEAGLNPVVQTVTRWSVEGGLQGFAYSGAVGTAEGLAEGKSLDQALDKGLKAGVDGIGPGVLAANVLGAAGKALEIVTPKKGALAPAAEAESISLESSAGDGVVKRATTLKEFISPEFYESSLGYQAMSKPARAEFDRLLADMAARGKNIEGASMVRLMDSGALAKVDKQGKSLLDSLAHLRDTPRLPGLQAQQGEIFDRVVDTLQEPGQITQANNPTCAGTSLQLAHIKADPADYLRVVDELTRNGEATLAGGQKMRLNESALKAAGLGDRRALADAIYQDSAMQFAKETGSKGQRVEYISNRPAFEASNGKLYPLTPELVDQIKAKGGSLTEDTVRMKNAQGEWQEYRLDHKSGAIMPGAKPVLVDGLQVTPMVSGLADEETSALMKATFGRQTHDLKIPEGFQERMATRDVSKLTDKDRLAMKWMLTAAADAGTSGRPVTIGVKWDKGWHAIQVVGFAEDGRFLVRNPQVIGADVDFTENGIGMPRDGSEKAVGLAGQRQGLSAVDHWTLYANLDGASASRFKPGQ